MAWDAGARQPHIHRDTLCKQYREPQNNPGLSPPVQAEALLSSCGVVRCWIPLILQETFCSRGRRLSMQQQGLHCRRAMEQGTSRRAGWALGRFLRSRNGHVGIVHHTLQQGPAPPPFRLCVLSKHTGANPPRLMSLWKEGLML